MTAAHWQEYQYQLRQEGRCGAKEPGMDCYCQIPQWRHHDAHRDGDRIWSEGNPT